MFSDSHRREVATILGALVVLTACAGVAHAA